MSLRARYRWTVLSVTIVAFMQTHLHRLGFASLIPVFVADLGLSYAAAGTIQTAYFWTYALAQVPVGLLTDRWGARRVMLICTSLLTLGGLAFAASGTYAALLLSRMVVGLGAAAVWVPGMLLIAQWFPSAERGRAAGLMSAGGGVGGTLGLVLVPVLAEALGWRLAYATTVVPSLITLALIAVLIRNPRERATAPTRRAVQGSLRRVLAVQAMWPLNINVIFSYGGYFSFITFLPSFLVRGLGLSQGQAGVVTALVTVGTVISWPLAGILSDRLGRRRPVFLFSQFVSLLALLVFALVAPHMGLLTVSLTALATGLLVGGLILPFVMVVDYVPRDLAATAAGLTNGACFLGAMILPIALGRIVDVTGSFSIAFLVAAGVQAVAFVAALFVTEPSRDSIESL
jgi:predicted MFS family arabinose efflux permease